MVFLYLHFKVNDIQSLSASALRRVLTFGTTGNLIDDDALFRHVRSMQQSTKYVMTLIRDNMLMYVCMHINPPLKSNTVPNYINYLIIKGERFISTVLCIKHLIKTFDVIR